MNNLFPIRTRRLQRLSLEGLIVAAGQALAILGSLVAVRVLTEFLSPADYGELALGMTGATLINQIAFGPLANGATRYYSSACELRDFAAYIRAVRRLLLFAIAAIAICYLISVGGVLMLHRADLLLMVTGATIYAVLSGYNAVLNGMHNAGRRRIIVAFHQGIEPWVRFVVAVALLIWWGAASTIAMFGYAIAALIVLASRISFSPQIYSDSTDAISANPWEGRMWKYSRAFCVFGLFTWAQLASDRWALEFFTSTKDVGIYAVLSQLGYYPLSLLGAMAMQFFEPILFQRAATAADAKGIVGVSRLSWRVTWLLLALTLVAFAGALAFNGAIFRAFAAREYAHASYLLPWMLLAGGIYAAAQSITLHMMIQLKTSDIVAPKIYTAVFAVAMNLVGAYWYGVVGIVVAKIVFSVANFVWMASVAGRLTERRVRG